MLALATSSEIREPISMMVKDFSELSTKRNVTHGSHKSLIINETVEGNECERCLKDCPGFEQHPWRKTCQACKCPRENHEIYHEQLQTVRERLGFKMDLKTSQIEPKKLGFTWAPPGILTSAKVQRYFDQLPQDKVPKIGTAGERYRDKQIAYQLPRQDLTINYCKNVDTEHRGSYDDFVAARNEIALDIGFVRDAPAACKCQGCNDDLKQGEMCVNAPKLNDNINWHPKCFKCTTCEEFLVDLTYCVFDDKVYCERHYAEMLKPRCSACDEGVKTVFTPEPEVSKQEQEKQQQERQQQEQEQQEQKKKQELEQERKQKEQKQEQERKQKEQKQHEQEQQEKQQELEKQQKQEEHDQQWTEISMEKLEGLLDEDEELKTINQSATPSEGLKRSKRCINSLDRSMSRSSSRMSKSRKSPSVASEGDYKEWFEKFDNQTTPDLTVPDIDYDFDSDVEEDFLMHVDDGVINGQDICKIDTEMNSSPSDENSDNDPNVSVSVTLNLNRGPSTSGSAAGSTSDAKTFKTKAEEFLELEKMRENTTRRTSIVPSTEKQQQMYVSMLHPEDFTTQTKSYVPHEHHQHLHNVGYNEWIKKFVDHHSSHLSLSDSGSDSDNSLNETDMLPLFKAPLKSKRKSKKAKAQK